MQQQMKFEEKKLEAAAWEGAEDRPKVAQEFRDLLVTVWRESAGRVSVAGLEHVRLQVGPGAE